MHYWTRKDGRFYTVIVTKDLLDTWTVIKSWGGKGRSFSSMDVVACKDINAAMQVVALVAKTRTAHGYVKQDALFARQPNREAANEQCRLYY